MKLLRFEKKYILPLALLALLLIIWIFKKGNETDRSDLQDQHIMQPKIEEIQGEMHSIKITLSGFTEPTKKIKIFAEGSGRVINIAAKEGSKISKGDPILNIDPKAQEETLQTALAGLEHAQLEHSKNKNLHEEEYITDLEIMASDASLKSAIKNLKQAEIEMNNTTVYAPCDGLIDKILVKEGSLIHANSTLISNIIGQSTFLAVAHASAKEVQDIKLGQKATIELANGVKTEGMVSFIGTVASNDTRTFLVEIESSLAGIENNNILGITAQVTIPSSIKLSHLIPASALSLSQQGAIGVKIISDEDKVLFCPVEIVDEESEGFWVTGLPSKAKIITTGSALMELSNALE
ncbi:hypothetical protein RLOatenuis_6390 [Rickettsiales bacterium]|nr:hypothetical protein RLOatenuis_6390 [Rickettsiales bacterium]